MGGSGAGDELGVLGGVAGGAYGVVVGLDDDVSRRAYDERAEGMAAHGAGLPGEVNGAAKEVFFGWGELLGRHGNHFSGCAGFEAKKMLSRTAEKAAMKMPLPKKSWRACGARAKRPGAAMGRTPMAREMATTRPLLVPA